MAEAESAYVPSDKPEDKDRAEDAVEEPRKTTFVGNLAAGVSWDRDTVVAVACILGNTTVVMTGVLAEEISELRSDFSHPRVFATAVICTYCWQYLMYTFFNDAQRMDGFWKQFKLSAAYNVMMVILGVLEMLLKVPRLNNIALFALPIYILINRRCNKVEWGCKGRVYAVGYFFYFLACSFLLNYFAVFMPLLTSPVISITETIILAIAGAQYTNYENNNRGIVAWLCSVACALEGFRFCASLTVFKVYLDTGDMLPLISQTAINCVLQSLVQTGAMNLAMTYVMGMFSKKGAEVEPTYKMCGIEISRELEARLPLIYYAGVWGSTFLVPASYTANVFGWLIMGDDPDFFGPAFRVLAREWHFVILVFVIQEVIAEALSMCVDSLLIQKVQKHVPRLGLGALCRKLYTKHGAYDLYVIMVGCMLGTWFSTTTFMQMQ